MKFVDYAGETIALILARPNRTTRPRFSVDLPADVLAALSNQTQRRNFARTIRHAYDYTAHFDTAASVTEFRLGLNRLTDETVAVPMWEDGVKLSASASIGATTVSKTALTPVRFGAEWIITNEDASIFEIVTITAGIGGLTVTLGSALTLNWPAGTMMFPLLFGRFAERPKLDAITPSQADAPLKFHENSPFSRRVTVIDGSIPLVGANVTELAALPLWNLEPDWIQPLDTTTANILFALLGPGAREEQSYVAPSQSNARGLEMQFTCNGRDAIAFVERIFTDRRATTRLFAVPTFRNDLKLTQNLPVAGSPNLITIESSEYSNATRPPHPGDPFLALVDPPDTLTGFTPVDPVRITNIALGNLTTDQSVTLFHSFAKTRLSHLLLVRFAEAKLVWEYITPSLAIVKIKFLEEPSEYAALQSEIPEPMICYRFTEKTPTPRISTFTNYENARTIDGQVFAPGPFDHGSIKISLRPGETRAELMSWGGNSAGNPLAKLLPLDLEADLELEILEADAGNPDAPLITLFRGDVMNVSQKGRDWRAEAVWLGRFLHPRGLTRKAPHFLVQKPDNNVIFSRPMALDPEPFKYGARILSMDDNGATLVCDHNKALDPIGAEENFFAGGFLQIGDPGGDTYKSRAITHSESGFGTIILTIDRPLPEDYIGGTSYIWPGYDGSIAQLIARFDPTGTIHGGHPFVTDTGPQIKAVEAKQSGGGKKG